MKILFITNIPSPYRVDFFNELGKYCDLTVCFERKSATDRDVKWKGSDINRYQVIYANAKPVGTDQSKGKGVIEVIKKDKFDRLIIAGYSSPSVMRAIFYCRRHHIPFIIESDGGFYKKDKFFKRIVKKLLLCGAEKHFTTCEEYIRYLKSLGIPENKIYKYPFTSLKQEDILSAVLSAEEKQKLRQELDIQEEKIVISVGQFIYRKGFDILLRACKDLSNNVGIYIIGGSPTEEYLKIIEELELKNVHFIPFQSKEVLWAYYRAADVFVFPTREDIWGLVINEAMANGLPVITTDKCIAGLELIENDKNGYIVPVDNAEALKEKILVVLENESLALEMAKNNLEKIQEYTIESMVKVHLKEWQIENGAK